MDIVAHGLVSTPNDGVDLQYRAGKPSIWSFDPRIAIVHYGVTDTLNALWRAQHYRGFYAHASIDGWSEHTDDGPVRGTYQVIHQINFDKRASHAGESSYKGKKGCNAFAFGIEIANPGPLIRGVDGKLRTVYGKVWPESDAIEARHKSGTAPREWTHWACYSDEEIDLVVQLVALWKHHYGIVDVVGHDDVAPGRKSDPGPAFPIGFVRRTVFGYD